MIWIVGILSGMFGRNVWWALGIAGGIGAGFGAFKYSAGVEMARILGNPRPSILQPVMYYAVIAAVVALVVYGIRALIRKR